MREGLKRALGTAGLVAAGLAVGLWLRKAPEGSGAGRESRAEATRDEVDTRPPGGPPMSNPARPFGIPWPATASPRGEPAQPTEGTGPIDRGHAATPAPSEISTEPPKPTVAPGPALGRTPTSLAQAGAVATVPVGTVYGRVRFEGTPPKARPLDRRADRFCGRTDALDESWLVSDGGIANVIVGVSSSTVPPLPPPPDPFVVEQRECLYRPRVGVLIAGQEISIRNADGTLHNVHAYIGPKTLFTQAQPPGLPPIARHLGDPSDVLRFQCDVHPWMEAYVVVSPHAYHAVTDASGRYTLAGLPPGRHTLVAWHERGGTRTTDVVVPAGGGAEADFTFTAP